MRKSVKENRIHDLLYALAVSICFFLFFYLFYSELTVYPTDPDFRFESDTYVHVRFAVEDGYFYSLSSYIYFILKSPLIIAGFLAAVCAAAVPLTGRLLDAFGCDMPGWARNILSFCLNLVMGFYIPFVNRQHYIGYQNANMWHNSTYILMKTFAIVTVTVFIRLFRGYADGIKKKDYILYTVLLFVTTAFKPSFFTVFAPTLAVMLLADLFIRKVAFGKVFIMALSVVPSFIVMLLESLVLFDGSGAGMVIAPFKTFFERGDHPKLSLVISPLFLIVVFFLCFRHIKDDRLFRCGILFLVIGFTEAMLIAEEGTRASDGNFLWGYSIALFFAFAIFSCRLWRSFKTKEISAGLFAAAAAVSVWHVISGMWHFVLLLQGFTYFK